MLRLNTSHGLQASVKFWTLMIPNLSKFHLYTPDLANTTSEVLFLGEESNFTEDFQLYSLMTPKCS